jgi:hypothetical protein
VDQLLYVYVILAEHMDSTDSTDYLDYGVMYDVGLFRITAWYLMQVNGQPAAVNMREMVWDEELARLAQRFSRNFYDNCYLPTYQPSCTLGYNDFYNLVMQTL